MAHAFHHLPEATEGAEDEMNPTPDEILAEMKRWSKNWANVRRDTGQLSIDDLIAHMEEWFAERDPLNQFVKAMSGQTLTVISYLDEPDEAAEKGRKK